LLVTADREFKCFGRRGWVLPGIHEDSK
jgi:hypothetical protein